MKRILLALLVAGSPAYPQGTVLFDNIAGHLVNAPVYESDAVTKLSGSQFMAQLLGGPSATSLASIATTDFLTDGYFLGGGQTIDSVAAGAIAWVQVEAWNTASGTSFDQAKASGLPNSWWQSSPFTVQTGGMITSTGFTQPGPLTGLGTSPLYLNSVPEPSPLALLGVGIASIIIALQQRRKPGKKPVSFAEIAKWTRLFIRRRIDNNHPAPEVADEP